MARAFLLALLPVGLVVGLAGCDADMPRQSRPEARSEAQPEAPSSAPPATTGAAPTETPSTGPPPSEQRVRFPRRPPDDDAAGLAEHLATAHRAVTDPRAQPGDVRRAAQFEQLAARTLALGPQRYADEVTGLLAPPARQRTRAHVRAARQLGAMTAPQPELPDWRVVEPPPPDELLGHYRAAERAIGVPWEYLAAIHLVETRMGRIRGVSTAGAQGPMQFLPTTWDLYGEGGDIQDVGDAVLAAARLLRANGAPQDMAGALWHYNPSTSYVDAVEAYAEQIRRRPATYRGYWHWRVLYKHVDGTRVLEPGYPRRAPATLP